MITPREALSYEISSAWWTLFCCWEWTKDLATWYLARKVNKKYARYVAYEKYKQKLSA